MASIWHISQKHELLSGAVELDVREVDGFRHAFTATSSGLWLVSEWSSTGARVAFRVAFSPDHLTVHEISPAGDDPVRVVMASAIGEQTATITIDPVDGTVSATTVLRPAEDVTFHGWPRDVVAALDCRCEGKVHTRQRGIRTGLVHASMISPPGGSFMYWQDLTRLGDFCAATRASAKDTVGGEWPELGFALPGGSEPLRAGESRTISAWHVALVDEVPDGPVEVADQYLCLLAQLYLHIDRPTPDYVEWRDRARASRSDLDQCDECWLAVDGRRYLRAYVGDDDHPPESMVQLAVVVPLIEFSDWSGHADPLTEDLVELAASFHDDRTGTLARWLPSAEYLLDGGEAHEGPRTMDSWYLFHPLLNLARLAARGDERARRQLLDSLDRVIEIAHHFDHRWPVLYDIDTLEVIKAEAAPGKGGELDVPGLYAHVMVQAFDLTGDERFLQEALTAAHFLAGKGFELAYQTNNVAFGMLAFLRLFQLTGDRELLGISTVLCACLFDNVGLWSVRYGQGLDRSSFCAVLPMPEAPYTAAYEEAEVAAVCLDYLVQAGEELAPPLAILLPELIRHVTAKLDAYYPPNIRRDFLSESPKTGDLDPDLWIPVEDLADGWDDAGTVGQEVYGAGIAFSTVSRTYVRVPDSDIQIACEYPFALQEATRESVVLHLYGDRRLTCRVRVLYGESGAQGIPWRDHWVTAGQDITIPLP